MSTITWIIDRHTGQATVEGLDPDEARLVADLLPAPTPINCARPLPAQGAAPITPPFDPRSPTLRVLRLYHGSVVDGPGRRSVAQLAGCPIGCVGCFVPETHDPAGGVALPVAAVVAALLDRSGAPRDGVTISGGEPFAQPDGTAALIRALKDRGIHTLLYSGYTLDALRRRPEPAVATILALADVLIDGPYVAALGDGAGEWRGSRNQRVIDLAASRRANRIVHLANT